MNINKSNILWLLVALLAMVPIVYFLAHVNDPSFRNNAMGNWFATMIGAFIGFLSAFEISRQQQKKEEQTKEKEELNHKVKILTLIKNELVANLEELTNRQPSAEEGTNRKVIVPGLRDELWNAFSDGGELQWIRDAELLDVISTAYHYIRGIIYLEERYFEATHFPGMMIQQEEYPKDRILRYLTGNDPAAIENIKEAIQKIDNSLANIKINNR